MKMTVKSLSIAVLAVMLVFALTGCPESEDASPPPQPVVSTPVDTVINISAIQGVIVPAKGETPVTIITENAQYRGTVTWIGNPSVFVASTEYTAVITLTAKSGFTLQGVSADFFKVAGAIATNAANSGVIIATFPIGTNVINISAIQGVTAPVNGGVPVTYITENEQYVGTVTWSPAVNGTFAAITQYTATIRLTPKASYTLNGVSANFFKVDGATSVSNDTNSGVITAVFPATAPTNITSVSISITAPVKGETPSTTAGTSGSAESGINFTISSVLWLPTDNPFLGGKVYAVSIVLTANI